MMNELMNDKRVRILEKIKLNEILNIKKYSFQM